MDKNIAKMKLLAAELRARAAVQRAYAAAHRRQALKPIYPGQDIICLGKADQIDAFAARSEARADIIEAELKELD